MWDEKYVSPKEIADLFGVTPRTVCMWCRDLGCPHLDFSKNPGTSGKPTLRLLPRDVRAWARDRNYRPTRDTVIARVRPDLTN